jgi:hypothetical protein
MIFVPGGTYRMGSDRHYPEEAPVHRVTVDGFWIDRTPVTNRDFRKFVNDTGYVTFAEVAPNPADYPGALPHMLKAGSLVFTPPKDPIDQRHWSRWWNFKFGANWRRPYGPRSAISGLDDHPVVHVAYGDATHSSTRPTRRRRAAFRTIRAAGLKPAVTIPAKATSNKATSKFHARCSRAVRTCALPTTAAATGRRRATRSRSIPRRATSDSVASFETGENNHERQGHER